MIFTSSAEYAVRAVTFLALQPPGTLSGARQISRAEQIPMPFLWKILQKLARKRLLRSFKGLRGGYELARPANQITLQDLMQAMNGEDPSDKCALGLTRCDEENPCPLHERWKQIRGQLLDMLQNTTVADLARTAAGRPGRPR